MPPRDLTVPLFEQTLASGRVGRLPVRPGQVLPVGVRWPPADPARRMLPAGLRRPPADPAMRLLPDSVARPAANLTDHSCPSRTQDLPPIDGQCDREVAAAVTRRAESTRLRFSSAIRRTNWDSIRSNPGAAIVTVVLALWVIAAVSVTLLIFG